MQSRSMSMSNTNGMADATVSKFTRILPLCIRKDGNGAIPGALGLNDSPGSLHSQGEQKENIRITLTYPSPACGTMNPHKEISLRLTNDDNPLFYYYLRITEAEFPELKAQQGLLVDFYGFPNQLVTLLERCDTSYAAPEDNATTYTVGGGGPKFILVMKVGGNISVLDIVESNPFKYLCHLSLQINAGSDGEVKKFLCDVTTGLKKDYQILADKYNHLVSSVENENLRVKEQMEYKIAEINNLRDQLHAQANSLSTKHFEDMTQEKEKLLKLQADLASKFELERNDLERRHSMAICGLEDRIASLETENRSLIQFKYKSETALQESAGKIKHYENDLKLLQQELTATKKQNEKLDHDYHEKQRVTGNLHNRVTCLETDLREKQNILQRQHEQISQLSEQKKNLEEHASAMINEVDRIKNVNQTVSGELIKANAIIKKLQDDIRSLNSKTKLQSQVTTEQERVIVDRDKSIQHLESEMEKLNGSLSTAESEVKRLSEAVTDKEIQIEALDKTIKSNENMISWLNKQLNEFQGLSNLSKFRQNLALSNSNQLLPPQQQQTSADQLGADSSRFKSHALENYSASSGGKRFGTAYTGGNVSNVNNGTPSWMNIYQSTSTPLDDDLSSRLEKVAASNEMRMNYSDLKSRFTDRFAIESSAEKSERKENDESSEKPKPNSRPPTWAKGRGGKVTLELGPATNKTGISRR